MRLKPSTSAGRNFLAPDALAMIAVGTGPRHTRVGVVRVVYGFEKKKWKWIMCTRCWFDSPTSTAVMNGARNVDATHAATRSFTIWRARLCLWIGSASALCKLSLLICICSKMVCSKVLKINKNLLYAVESKQLRFRF